MTDEQEVTDVINDLAQKLANAEVSNSAKGAKIKRLERELAQLYETPVAPQDVSFDEWNDQVEREE